MRFYACRFDWKTTRTFENPDSRGEVVDTPGGAERSSKHGWRGDEIVGEAVVQVALAHVNKIGRYNR